MSFLNGSPRRSRDSDDGEDLSNPFNITSIKNASVERLKRWRDSALVLNASRRFRYTTDLQKEEKEQKLRKIWAHGQAIRAAYLFKVASLNANAAHGDFPIGPERLALISRDHKIDVLLECGGVRGLADLLKTNLETGIQGNDADLIRRKNAFGSNNCPQKKGRSFLMFVWDACKDLTLIILMVAAVALLALEIISEGIEEGWYDGGSIAFAVILVIVITSISDYKQYLQFRRLNEEKRNLLLKVIRDGRRVEIPIYDIVVGDVVPLKIGDKVPADGNLISGHSLAVDESSMSGDSKIVHKDSKDPFLRSGCEVVEGSGTMLVTSVGIYTEWGLLMASLSEDDTVEETPLEVRLNGVATIIGIFGIIVAAVIMLVLLFRYFTGLTKNLDGSVQFEAGKTKIVDAIHGVIKIIAVAVTIVVVAVPEGLPLAVTLILAYSVTKMIPDKALVRRLWACETMGSVTTICTDKTGTLTLNEDPCQPDVKDAVRLCQKAGVKVRMVTGDNVQTAKAIALECGILGSSADATEPNIIEGEVFRALSDTQRDEIAEKISVMGRSSPNDKLLLVEALRRKRHIVALIGDGANDAPALHKADVGLAMGTQGTEVAKESSDIIILDDSFASVVKVVRWGRSVYANIQKVIQFQLTINATAVTVNAVAAVISGDVLLNAVQLLWVNLIMDTLGALALATEPPTDQLMDRRPVDRRECLMTNIM